VRKNEGESLWKTCGKPVENLWKTCGKVGIHVDVFHMWKTSTVILETE
jgi:hypothetical protein